MRSLFCQNSRFSLTFSTLASWGCIVLTICLVLTACSSDEPEKPSQRDSHDTEYDEQFEANSDQIDAALRDNTIIDVATATAFCSGLEGFEYADNPEDGFVSLHFKGNREYFIDFKGTSLLQEEDADASDDFDPADYLDEMDEALGWEDSSAANLPQRQSFPTRADGSLNNGLLNKRNVLFWDPYNIDVTLSMEMSSLQKVIREKGRKMDVTYAQMGSKAAKDMQQLLSYLKKMDDYDVVFIATHGDVCGRLIIPNDGSMPPMRDLPEGSILNPRTNKWETTYALTNEWCTKYLPKELNRTIVWTSVCNVFRPGGAFKEYCDGAGVADFYGADQTVSSRVSFSRFKKFYSNFSSGTPSYRAYSWSRSPEFYDGSDSQGYYYSGYWCMADKYTSLSYARSMPSRIKDAVAGKFAFAKGKLAEIFGRSTRSTASNVTIGFAVVKQGEATERLIPLSESVVDDSKVTQKNFNDVACVELALKPDILEEGTYTYRTYIAYGDGLIEYSPTTQTVTLSGQIYCYSFEGHGTATTESWNHGEHYIRTDTATYLHFSVYKYIKDGKNQYALSPVDWDERKRPPIEIGAEDVVTEYETNDYKVKERWSSEFLAENQFIVRRISSSHPKPTAAYWLEDTTVLNVDMGVKTAVYTDIHTAFTEHHRSVYRIDAKNFYVWDEHWWRGELPWWYHDPSNKSQGGLTTSRF